MSTSPIIRIHPVTRPKINAIQQQRPAWSLQTIIDNAIESLATTHGFDIKPKSRTRKTAA